MAVGPIYSISGQQADRHLYHLRKYLADLNEREAD